MTEQQLLTVERLINGRDAYEFHHGDCIGADKEAHQIAQRLEVDVVIHPPEDTKFRAWCTGIENEVRHTAMILPSKPYLQRNQDIVDSCDLLIATPGEPLEVLRSGTWSTVRKGRKKKSTEVIVVYPNGEIGS